MYKLSKKIYEWYLLTVKIYLTNSDWNHKINIINLKYFMVPLFWYYIGNCISNEWPVDIFKASNCFDPKQWLLLEYKSTRKNFMFPCTSLTVQLIDKDGQVTLVYNPRHDPNPRTVILNLRSSSIIFMFNTVATRIVSVLKSLRFIDYNLWDPNNNL